MKKSSLTQFVAIAIQSKIVGFRNPKRARRILFESLKQMPGVPAKIGQFLNARSNDLETVPGPPSLSVQEIKEKIRTDCPELDQDLDKLSPIGIQASIGQVHYAKLRTGEDIVIKVRLPGVEQEVERQLDVFFRWAKIAASRVPKIERFTNGIQLNTYQTYFLDQLRKETNYLIEAQNQERLIQAWAANRRICIPRIFSKYTKESILVQSFEGGLPLKRLIGQDSVTRRACAELLLSFLMESIGSKEILHGDMQPDNWVFHPEKNQLVLYDFGSVISIEGRYRHCFSHLLKNRGEMSPLDLMLEYEKLGFRSDQLVPIIDKLPELTRILFEPFEKVSYGEWDPKSWNFSERTRALLGEGKQNFRSSGPPWFLSLMRVISQIYSALCALDVPIGPIQWLGAEPTADSIQGNSLSLHVLVLESGREKVSIQMPLRSLEILEDIIPETVREQIENRGYNLAEIKKNALSLGAVPQSLFEADLDEKVYKVWIS